MPKRSKSKTAFIIRSAKPKDRQDVIRNYYGYYEELKRNPMLGLTLYKKKPPIKDEIKWFDGKIKKMRKGDVIFSVAEADGRVVGASTVERMPNHESRHIGQFGIAIKEGYRSIGIGTALLKDAIKKAKGKYALITLSVFGNNVAAIGLYKKLGFKKYGTLPDGLRRGRHHISHTYMYRRL